MAARAAERITDDEAAELAAPGRPSVSLPEHLAIIEAVCARDPERAERAMRVHRDSVLKVLSTIHQ